MTSLQTDACNSGIAGRDVRRADSHEGTLNMEVRLGKSRGGKINGELEKCMQQSGLALSKRKRGCDDDWLQLAMSQCGVLYHK